MLFAQFGQCVHAAIMAFQPLPIICKQVQNGSIEQARSAIKGPGFGTNGAKREQSRGGILPRPASARAVPLFLRAGCTSSTSNREIGLAGSVHRGPFRWTGNGADGLFGARLQVSLRCENLEEILTNPAKTLVT